MTSVFLCSPHKDGAADHLAEAFFEGVLASGAPARKIVLRNYVFKPCSGCGACFQRQGDCVLNRGEDQAEELLREIINCRLAVFAAPIYFYALPGGFKCLIDRGQKFWAKGSGAEISRSGSAIALLAGARREGKKLFEGSLLTLDLFLNCLGKKIEEKLLFRGVETKKDITSEIFGQIFQTGKKWGLLLKQP